VDDDEDSATTFAILLQIRGNVARTADDGLAALEIAEEFRPDVVFLDVGLPELDGFEVARRIRQRAWGKAVALIAVTGWGQEGDRLRAKDAGFDHHLVKPVEPATLFRLLDSLTPTAPG
jgi:CheY-like chemotaxis protein